MFTTFLAYQVATTSLSSIQWIGIGAVVGSSSTFILTLLFNTTLSPSSSTSNAQSELMQETLKQHRDLQSNTHELLESTHHLHHQLHQQVNHTLDAFDEYTQIRQAVFQSIRERQALEKNITSILKLINTEEIPSINNETELKTIQNQQKHEIALLQEYIQNLLQCMEEKDKWIEALQDNHQQPKPWTI